ncbi:MAG: TetR family transcriptional regulator [Clostridiales bacterium]|jgi:probable dihydroxyacetone kinase regulator|nr:TetR family transcriptional regulator [Clostridiales bacterium]
MSEITKQALAASLKKLLEQKPIDKITVKDIVEDCGVNRHTFYYHFQDIYELIEWLCINEANEVLGTHKTYDTWKEGFLDLYGYLHDNKAIVMNAYHSKYRNYLENYIRSLVRPYIIDFLEIQSEGMKISEEKFEFIADTYTYGIVSLAMDWIADDMMTRYNNSMKFFLRLLDGSMKYTLQKFAEQ